MTIGEGQTFVHKGKTYKLTRKIGEKDLSGGNYANFATVYTYEAECEGEIHTVRIIENDNGNVEFKV
jgi:hypothetical protein